MMKWDVKHDKAKRVIDAFLDNAEYWQEREDLADGLTDEEKELVNEEVTLMIASIRKRYKLQERLPEQQKAEEKSVPMPESEKAEELKTEVEAENKTEEKTDGEPAKPKRTRKKSESTGEKKERKPRAKKEKEVVA